MAIYHITSKMYDSFPRAYGDSSVVRAPDSWLKGRTCRSGGRIFFSRVDFLCWLLFRYPFHPRVTAVARKRSRSFCQKCRWQVIAKHAYTLRMWLCMKWHGAWLYGVHRTCAETAAVSCCTSHASAVIIPLWWIFKTRYHKLVTHVEPHASAVSLVKKEENSAIWAIINQLLMAHATLCWKRTCSEWDLKFKAQSTMKVIAEQTHTS